MMELDKFQTIDNYMFEYLSSADNFNSIISSINTYKQQHVSLQKPKIPLSPQSPHSSMRSPTRLLQRPQAPTDSQILSSQTFQSERIPTLINDVFTIKHGSFSVFHYYKAIPKEIQIFEAKVVNFLKKQAVEGQLSLQKTVKNEFYEQEMSFKMMFSDYYHHAPERNPTLLQFICESLFNIPVVLARPLLTVLSGYEIQNLKLSHSEPPVYEYFDEISLATIEDFYNRIKHISSQQRIFTIFGNGTYLTFQQIYALCLETILYQPQFDFIQPFLYQNSFAYTCAVRFFFDFDVSGTWKYTVQNFKKTGISFIQLIFDIQQKEDISGESSIFGYEQFYVIYCLYAKYSNGDINNKINESQLKSFNQFCYSSKVISRVYKGHGRKLLSRSFGYADFIVFLLSDAIFDSQISCEFWFKICDVDEDNLVGQADLRYFLVDQIKLWDRIGLGINLSDILRQLGDSIKFGFSFPNYFTLTDFQKSFLHGDFFDMLFSAQKFEQFESRDQYVGNVSIQESLKNKVQHGESLIWRNFWEAAYDDLIGDD